MWPRAKEATSDPAGFGPSATVLMTQRLGWLPPPARLGAESPFRAESTQGWPLMVSIEFVQVPLKVQSTCPSDARRAKILLLVVGVPQFVLVVFRVVAKMTSSV